MIVCLKCCRATVSEMLVAVCLAVGTASILVFMSLLKSLKSFQRDRDCNCFRSESFNVVPRSNNILPSSVICIFNA